MARGNPYAIDQEAAVNGQGPNTPYAAPSLESGSPYLDVLGWGVHLSREGLSTPDHMRLGTIETREFYPEANDPAGRNFYGMRDANEKARHSVETVDADGWTEAKGSYKVGPNPRENPGPEPRPTGSMAPRSYFFTRPFDQLTKGNGARYLNSMRFSMASHRRTYPIGGMQPVRNARNTFRLEPAPWDMDIVDRPQDDTTNVPYAWNPTVEVTPSSPLANRTWRL